MTSAEITNWRLRAQMINHHLIADPAAVVARLGAVQAQDYGGAQWAIGLRSGLDQPAIERACNEGRILRTHVMRPTWHFVTPQDIRWLLDLTADRVRKQLAYGDRTLGVTDRMRARTNDLLTATLTRSHRSRTELTKLMTDAGILDRQPLMFVHLIMHAELDGLICSGPRVGKEPSYALLADRAPNVPRINRDQALAQLTKRYFAGHGPATAQDFAWWSGLTLTDARNGIEACRSTLTSASSGVTEYWMATDAYQGRADARPYLLPNYDEYIVGYTDRDTIFDARPTPRLDSRANPLFMNTILFRGQIIGTWRRTIRKSTVIVEPHLFDTPSDLDRRRLTVAATDYGRFLGLSATMAD